MAKITAIVQARMGSTRLPGKVMKEVCGKTMLEHCISRILQSKELDDVVIATTNQDQDSIILEQAKNLGVKSSVGDEFDVLARYHHAANEHNADIVVRITSDCPLYDWTILDKMLKIYREDPCDYMSNFGQKRVFPRGLETEIFSIESLNRAHNNATMPHEREHVTPYIYQNPELFDIKHFTSTEDNSNHRWALDTKEDLEFIIKIYENLYPKKEFFNTIDIVDFLNKNPELMLINSHIQQKTI